MHLEGENAHFRSGTFDRTPRNVLYARQSLSHRVLATGPAKAVSERGNGWPDCFRTVIMGDDGIS